jgi:hypothetical protein
MKMIIFAVAILSSVASIPTSVYATVNSTPGVGPSGEDPFPPGTEWTYNSKSGSLCSTTPDSDVHCENVGEGRPCDEVRDEADPSLTCSDSPIVLPKDGSYVMNND